MFVGPLLIKMEENRRIIDSNFMNFHEHGIALDCERFGRKDVEEKKEKIYNNFLDAQREPLALVVSFVLLILRLIV